MNQSAAHTLSQLSPEVLREIENLQLAARESASGIMAGVHRSLRRGTSVEFSEHKLYSPGDDIRHIDWSAYAKTDRFHVKQFEDETNLRIELLIDHSGSMGFKNGGSVSKLRYANTLAAAISYLTLRQGDSTGLVTFANTVTAELPPRSHSSHLLEILALLAQLSPAAETGVGPCLERFAQTRRKRTIAILFSDLLDPNPELPTLFRQLIACKHEVALLHILDPAELDFPYDNPAQFQSMEDERNLFIHPRILKNSYQREMKQFLEKTNNLLRTAGVDYHLITTDTAPQSALANFLRARVSKS